MGQVTWQRQAGSVTHGDLFVVSSWQPLAVETERGLDLFRFSDTPARSVPGTGGSWIPPRALTETEELVKLVTEVEGIGRIENVVGR
jgi:hypothetical protein